MGEHSPSIRYLRELIAIPSVNPMGRDDQPEAIVGEHRMAEHLAAVFRRLGLDAAVVGSGGRESVVAEAVTGPDAETLLVASHDLEFVLRLCDRVLVLDGGRIVADGPARTILGDEALMLAHGLERPHSLTPHGGHVHPHGTGHDHAHTHGDDGPGDSGDLNKRLCSRW